MLVTTLKCDRCGVEVGVHAVLPNVFLNKPSIKMPDGWLEVTIEGTIAHLCNACLKALVASDEFVGALLYNDLNSKGLLGRYGIKERTAKVKT